MEIRRINKLVGSKIDNLLQELYDLCWAKYVAYEDLYNMATKKERIIWDKAIKKITKKLTKELKKNEK